MVYNLSVYNYGYHCYVKLILSPASQDLFFLPVTGFPIWLSMIITGILATVYTTIVSTCFCKTALYVHFLHSSKYTIHMYSGITSGRVLNGELLHTKILEVNLFAFAYRLFHRDFSPINGTYYTYIYIQLMIRNFQDTSALYLADLFHGDR